MIILSSTFRVQPGQGDALAQLAAPLVEATRREPGCLRYGLHQDVHDTDAFLFFETWQSLDHLRAHFRTGHFLAFVDRLPEFVQGERELRVYETDGPLDFSR